MKSSHLRREIQTVSHTILLALGIVYLIIAAAHQMVITEPLHKLILTSLASASALFIFVSVAILKYTKRQASTFSLLLFVSVMAINSFAHLYLTKDIIQSTNIIMLILAMGGLFTISRLYYGILFSIVVLWIALIHVIDPPLDLRIHFYFALVLSVVASIFVFRNRLFIVHQASDRREKIELLANQDPLTGCLRRHAFDQRGHALIAASCPKNKAIGIIFCDIDYFKRLNDSSGHSTGDAALTQVGTVLSAIANKYQLICGRMGGEEFALLGQLSHETTKQVATEINQNVLALQIVHPDSPIGEYLTMSVGFTNRIARHADELSEFCSVADRALYQAKSMGRNRIAAAGLISQSSTG